MYHGQEEILMIDYNTVVKVLYVGHIFYSMLKRFHNSSKYVHSISSVVKYIINDGPFYRNTRSDLRSLYRAFKTS